MNKIKIEILSEVIFFVLEDMWSFNLLYMQLVIRKSSGAHYKFFKQWLFAFRRKYTQDLLHSFKILLGFISFYIYIRQ